MSTQKKTDAQEPTDTNQKMPPNEKGTGLYNLAEAIGGGGETVIGDDNPGREEKVTRNDMETKTPE